MEKVFFVKNDELEAVNSLLSRGGRIKTITPVANNVAAFGFTSNGTYETKQGAYLGDVYTYIVVEYVE